jgi:hypothetical protein
MRLGEAKAARRWAVALSALVVCLAIAGCGDDPEIIALARQYAKNQGRIAFVTLHDHAIELKTTVEENAATEKKWLCFTAEASTYNEKTGQITLPSEEALEKKFLGLLLPQSRSQAALAHFHATLTALDKEEFAKVVVEAGCTS